MQIVFTVPGQAVPWARAGGGKTGHRFTPAKQRSYAGVLKLFCQRAMRGGPLITGPIELSVMAEYGWPKSWNEKRRSAPGAQWKTSRPDTDNLSKLIKDALNTVAWSDDAQVVSEHVWKRYSETPRLIVKIIPLEASAG
jgi:Holliday junction resolvase RusA-like endonuclease